MMDTVRADVGPKYPDVQIASPRVRGDTAWVRASRSAVDLLSEDAPEGHGAELRRHLHRRSAARRGMRLGEDPDQAGAEGELVDGGRGPRQGLLGRRV